MLITGISVFFIINFALVYTYTQKAFINPIDLEELKEVVGKNKSVSNNQKVNTQLRDRVIRHTFFMNLVSVAVLGFLLLMIQKYVQGQSKSFYQSLNHLAKESENLVNTDTSDHTSISIVSDCELGILARNFKVLHLKLVSTINQLKKCQNDLEQKAHQLRLVDITSSTLHNVSNILNSLKTSTQTLIDLSQDSPINSLIRANDLLRQNFNSLEDFISNSPKGKKLMKYYLKIEELLVSEHQKMDKQVQRLNDKTDAIVEVIRAQQNYLRTSSLCEEYVITDIIDNALTMQSGTIERYNIEVIKNYSENPQKVIDKTKLIHILINIINNAKEAMLELESEKRKLTIAVTRSEEGGIIIRIDDSGKGITAEELDKLFSPGFTTHEHGHGLGLYSCRNYMTEMNGEIWAESKGRDQGASFILKFFPEENLKKDLPSPDSMLNEEITRSV